MYKPTITEAQKPNHSFRLRQNQKHQTIEYQVRLSTGRTIDKRINLQILRSLCPLGVSEKTFVGYPTIFHAFFVAEKFAPNSVSIVYQIEEDPLVLRAGRPDWYGRFYVYICKERPLRSKNVTTPKIRSNHLPQGVNRGVVVNLTRHPRQDFKQDMAQLYFRFRIDEAAVIIAPSSNGALGKDGVTAHRLLRRALISTPYFDDEDIAASSSQNPQDPDSYEVYNSSKLQIDRMQENGRTIPVHPSGKVIGNSEEYCSLDTLQQMNFSVTIGEGPMARSLASVLRTLAHEGIHVLQGYRANHVLKRWRHERLNFEGLRDWIQRESRRPNSGVGLLDTVYVLDKCDTYASVNSAIELEAHLDGFILALSTASASELREILRHIDVVAETYVEKDPHNKWTRMMYDKYSFGISLTYSALGKSIQNIIMKEVTQRSKNPKIRTLYTWINESISTIIVEQP